MSIFIDGFVISMYRSFGPEFQKIGPFGQINVIIGQNNSGKSNILLFLKEHLRDTVRDMSSSPHARADPRTQNDLDIHRGGSGTRVTGIALKLNGDKYKEMLNSRTEIITKSANPQGAQILQLLEQLLRSKALCYGTETAWFLFDSPGIFLSSLLAEITEECQFSIEVWHWLYSTIMRAYHGGATGGAPSDPLQCIPLILHQLCPNSFFIPQIDVIPALRRVGEASLESETKDFSGVGIITKLARFQHPTHSNQHEKQQFTKINQFLQVVLGNSSARIEIPHDRSDIYVEIDRRSLPLASLGTGVHQVIILAAAATVVEKQILCIEEPELHLHPVLQRKLLRYLKEETDNQYFITTHSAHLLDTPDIHIFHVTHEEGASRVQPVYTSAARSNICFDLGYRPSDLMQANSILWVEGPTDRLYLKHWLHAAAPELVEGLHYSIMFYGGRLLCHLSAEDPDVKDFISLRRLNRSLSILMDSDRAGAEDEINATKARVQEEFNKGPGFAWVTQGREIENYIPPSLLEKCVKATHPAVVSLSNTGQYAHAYFYENAAGTVKVDADKVKLAHAVIEEPAELDVLDLREKIEKLVAFIRSANSDESILLKQKP